MTEDKKKIAPSISDDWRTTFKLDLDDSKFDIEITYKGQTFLVDKKKLGDLFLTINGKEKN